jgi:methionyl-tRNA formyltransferase
MAAQDLRILYMGMLGQFSLLPLQSLVDANINVCAVVVPGVPTSQPGPDRDLPVTQPGPDSIATLAGDHGIPLVGVSDLSDRCVSRVATFEPDVLMVACFPYILPPSLRSLPRRGCFNLHPSILPAYRGPAPLFWQFRMGETRTGVTLHRIIAKPDSGDIVLQRTIELAEGVTEGEISIRLARLGGAVMLEALDLLDRQALPSKQQQEKDSSYFSWPREKDFRLSTRWSARRAYSFIQGTSNWGRKYEIEADGLRFTTRSALAYSSTGRLPAQFVKVGRELQLQFSPGVLRIPAPATE